jgi:DNA-directed RNA polymerase specialized sigma24 family protein
MKNEKNPGDSRIQVEAERLLPLIRAGDRDAMARFVLLLVPYILRRCRGKLRRLQRQYDIDDLLASTGRRLDRFLVDSAITAETLPQLFNLVHKTAQRTLDEKLRSARGPDLACGELDPDAAQAPEPGDPLAMQEALALLSKLATREPERTILALHARGVPCTAIAADLHMPAGSVRWRLRHLLAT